MKVKHSMLLPVSAARVSYLTTTTVGHGASTTFALLPDSSEKLIKVFSLL